MKIPFGIRIFFDKVCLSRDRPLLLQFETICFRDLIRIKKICFKNMTGMKD